MNYKYHYVYRITNTITEMHYYGDRSCNCHPSEDIGIKYFSTSSLKLFINDQKENPQDYKYKIVKIFETCREDAKQLEVDLHKKFDVKNHKKFINRANQTSKKFNYDNLGKVVSDETKQLMSESRKCTIVVIDKKGHKFRVNSNDKRYLSGELVGHTIGKFVAVDSMGNKFHISKNDYRYLSGELVAESKGRIVSEKTKLKKSKLSKGRIWISNQELAKTKFIFPVDLEIFLTDGWIKGRVKF